MVHICDEGRPGMTPKIKGFFAIETRYINTKVHMMCTFVKMVDMIHMRLREDGTYMC